MCEPGLLIQHHYLTSQMGTNSHRHPPKSCGNLSRRMGYDIEGGNSTLMTDDERRGGNYILKALVLDVDDLKANRGVMVSCPQTVGHIVCLKYSLLITFDNILVP